MDTKRYVVLDLDGTLHPGTAGLDLLEELTQRGLCSPSGAARLSAFVRSLQPEDLHTRKSVSIAYQLWADAIRGAATPAVREAADEVWGRKRGEVFPYVRPAITMLRQHSYQIVLLSGSPHEIVSAAAADLGADHAQGAEFDVDSGVYSGRVLVAPGTPGAKLGLLGSMLPAAPGLDSTIAIGNSVTDIDLLGAVGHPIAFEPDQLLRRAATRFAWPVADRDSVRAVMNAAVRAQPTVS